MAALVLRKDTVTDQSLRIQALSIDNPLLTPYTLPLIHVIGYFLFHMNLANGRGNISKWSDISGIYYAFGTVQCRVTFTHTNIKMVKHARTLTKLISKWFTCDRIFPVCRMQFELFIVVLHTYPHGRNIVKIERTLNILREGDPFDVKSSVKVEERAMTTTTA